jgi:dihydropteroate synthase
VIDAIHDRWPERPLSIDTQKAEVARQAVAHGVSVINDVSALRRDPRMADVVSESACPVILMHSQGVPRTMQNAPRYRDVVAEVRKFFEERLAFAASSHIPAERIILDPGIGFGKTVEHNLALLKHLTDFLQFGRPLMVGMSRKSFIGKVLADGALPVPPEERLEGSLAAALWAVGQGASGLRVHDVLATRRALHLWEGIREAL